MFKEDVPRGTRNHILLRVESETDDSNKSEFVTNPVIVVEVCGVFDNSIDPDVVDDADSEVRQLLKPLINSTIAADSQIRLNLVRPESSTYLSEDDGTQRFYRKLTRWSNRVSHP